MEAITLPSKVQSRSCFVQMMGAWAIEPTFLESGIQQIDAIGIEKIWARNEKLGDYPMFSPSIHTIADHLPGHTLPAGWQKVAQKAIDAQAADKASQGDSEEADMGPPPYINYGGTAIIPVSGPLSKMPTSLGHMFGGSSTVGMRKALALALADNSVQRILFHIDSPGGTVAGTGDLGDEIHAAGLLKPTAAYIEDLGASAAYWIASQTQTVYASPHAQVGSIGVYTVVHDSSEAAAKQGVKVHVIKTGAHKGGIIPGAPVTDAAIQKIQATVDSMHNSFIDNVARGRGIAREKIAALADGSVYPAREAAKLSLLDGLTNFRGALTEFAAAARKPVRMQTLPYSQRADTADIVVGADRGNAAGSALVGAPGEGVQMVVIGSTTSTAQTGPTIVFAPSATEGVSSQAAATTARSEKQTDGSNTNAGLLDSGDNHNMSQPPTAPAGSPPAATAPTPEAFAELQRQVGVLQAQLVTQGKVSLDGEKDRLLADYAGIVTKEDVAKINDMPGLQAAEAIARRFNAKKTGAAPATVVDTKVAANLADSTAKLQGHLAERYGIVPTPGVKQ